MSKTTNQKRCGECGARAVANLAKVGRTATYRNMELPISASVEIPTCSNCGAEWIDAKTAVALDEELELTYQARVRQLLNEALGRIIDVAGNQARVERALGVSAGYLSKLKRGERNPSVEIVSALWLISKDPKRRLEEAEEIFSRPVERKRAAW